MRLFSARNLVSSRIMLRKWLDALRAYFPSLNPDYNPFPAHRRQLARICVSRGNVFFEEHQYDRALDEYNKAIDWNPDSGEAFCSRACVYLERAEYDLALADSNKAIQLNLSLAPAICNRGSAYLGKGDLTQAVSNYDHAVQVKPDFALPFANRAFVRLFQGNMNGAIKDCDRAVELDPNLAIAFSNRGMAAFCQGDFEKAAKDFDVSAKQDPDSGDSIWLYLANARAGRVEPAYLERHQSEPEPLAWPESVVRFLLLGTLTIDSLLNTIQEKNANKHQQQLCAAFFYAGERELLEGRPQQAGEFFVRAIELGATNCAEFVAAQSELRLVHSGISQ